MFTNFAALKFAGTTSRSCRIGGQRRAFPRHPLTRVVAVTDIEWRRRRRWQPEASPLQRVRLLEHQEVQPAAPHSAEARPRADGVWAVRPDVSQRLQHAQVPRAALPIPERARRGRRRNLAAVSAPPQRPACAHSAASEARPTPSCRVGTATETSARATPPANCRWYLAAVSVPPQRPARDAASPSGRVGTTTKTSARTTRPAKRDRHLAAVSVPPQRPARDAVTPSGRVGTTTKTSKARPTGGDT